MKTFIIDKIVYLNRKIYNINIYFNTDKIKINDILNLNLNPYKNSK
jgi:hypothetical protein